MIFLCCCFSNKWNLLPKSSEVILDSLVKDYYSTVITRPRGNRIATIFEFIRDKLIAVCKWERGQIGRSKL